LRFLADRVMKRGFGIWAAVVLCAAGTSTRGAEPDVALQRALDQPVTLVLKKEPLSGVFKQIAATAKIPLQVDPASYDLLPYGDTTQVSVEFNQSRLRDALQDVLVPLGLQEEVAGNVVLIRPSSALAHIGRRADWEELKLLKELWDTELKPVKGGTGAAGGFSLQTSIRAALDGRKDLLVPMAGAGESAGGAGVPATAPGSAQDKALEQINRQLPMSAYRALDMYCQLTNQIWFVEAGALYGGPTGGTVQIMTQRKWIERQLERPIHISRTNEPLEVVVADLSQQSGIRFVPEPGLYQAVPVIGWLRVDNATVRGTLDSLQGNSVAFEVRDDSILLKRVQVTGAEGNVAAKSDNIVGRITVPVGEGGKLQMEIFIRESDLTSELNDVRVKRVKEAVEGLQKAWAGPATLPAGTQEK
jgi:hypothetical protein